MRNELYFKRILQSGTFLDELKAIALKAGRVLVEKALVLWYCFIDQATPRNVKVHVAAALVYFLFPIDAIPDLTPILGYSDDMAILLTTFNSVKQHIRAEHKEAAQQQARAWFPEASV